MTEAERARERVRQLLDLTQRLTERLATEADAFEAHRPHEVAPGVAETQELANQYRREVARVKAEPDLLSPAPAAARQALIDATRTFETTLARHARALEAAKTVSEGLVRVIASEVAAQRAKGVGYGAAGQATAGDARAVALNRTA
jgi:hypothetical protein